MYTLSHHTGIEIYPGLYQTWTRAENKDLRADIAGWDTADIPEAEQQHLKNIDRDSQGLEELRLTTAKDDTKLHFLNPSTRFSRQHHRYTFSHYRHAF